MRARLIIASACLLALCAGCGQKGGLYLPDAAPKAVHTPPALPSTAAPPTAPPPTAPPSAAPPSTTTPPSSPAPASEPATSPDAQGATPPGDDPATHRKIPTTPDPSASQ